VEYTERDRVEPDALLSGGDYTSVETTCTSGIEAVRNLFESYDDFNSKIS